MLVTSLHLLESTVWWHLQLFMAFYFGKFIIPSFWGLLIAVYNLEKRFQI